MNPAPPVTMTRIASALRVVGSGSGRRTRAARRSCAGAERRARADDRVVGRDRAALEHGAGADDRVDRLGVVGEHGVVVQHRRSRPARRLRRPRPRRRPSRRPRAPAATRRRRRSAPGPRRARRRRRRRRPAPRRPAQSRGRRAPAARPSAPPSTSACACRYFSGVPMSSQYASLAIANRRPGSSSMRGNVSRSTDTVSRGGMRSSTAARARRCRR